MFTDWPASITKDVADRLAMPPPAYPPPPQPFSAISMESIATVAIAKRDPVLRILSLICLCDKKTAIASTTLPKEVPGDVMGNLTSIKILVTLAPDLRER